MAKQGRSRNGRRASLDARLAKALNHPVRTEIIAILSDRAASPSELAETLDMELSNVSYHVRTLHELDCLEVVDRTQVRGAMKTRYRATTRMLLDTDHWSRLGKETRAGISINAVNEVIDRATQAILAGSLDERTDRAVITLKLDADERLWSEAQTIVREAYERLCELEAEGANRRGPGSETFRMTVSLLAYESPSGAPLEAPEA
ncbi:MAG: helix-turn-helix domain-containing protein [Solirubrobacterales bacterium]